MTEISKCFHGVTVIKSTKMSITLQYLLFTLADLLGNWSGHLQSYRLSLPFVASTGHDRYTKSLRWFLDEMADLPEGVEQEFLSGNWVVRRKTSYFGGASGDYIIETTMMATFKGREGIGSL